MDEAKRIIQDYPSYTHFTSDARMFINEHSCMEEIKRQLVGLVKISELKSLVESHENLFSIWPTIEEAKKQISENRYNDDQKVVSVYESWIKDVEACQ